MDNIDHRRVRVELVEAPTVDPSEPTAAPSPGPFGRFVAAAAVVGLILALWALARPAPGSDAANEPIAETTTIAASPSTLVTEPEPESPVSTFLLPATGIAHVIAWEDGFLASGDAAGDATGPTVLASVDAVNWRTKARITGVDAILGLTRVDARFRALTARPAPERATELRVFDSSDGTDWQPVVGYDEVVVSGTIRSGSLRGDRWVVLVDRPAPQVGTYIHTGTSAGEELQIQMAPGEFLNSYAATESGFVASTTRQNLTSLDSSEPSFGLARWTANWGLQNTLGPLGPFETSPTVVDGEQLGVVIDGQMYVATDGDAFSWVPAISAPSDMTSLLPARAGVGALAMSSTPTVPTEIWVTVGRGDWRSGIIEIGTDPELLAVIENHAVLTVESDGRAVLLRAELGPTS